MGVFALKVALRNTRCDMGGALASTSGLPSGGVAKKIEDLNRLPKLLLVNGSREHRHEMVVALRLLYDIEVFSDARLALREARVNRPDLIILGEDTPPSGGMAVVETLVEDAALCNIPFIVTADGIDRTFIERASKKGAQAALRQPLVGEALVQTVSQVLKRGVESGWSKIEPVQQAALRSSLSLFNTIADALTDSSSEVTFEQIKTGCAPLVEAVSNAQFRDVLLGVRHHDDYTYAHSLRVATFLTLFGYGTGLRGDDLRVLSAGGLMHDVGKVCIPHAVLNKPGKLTPDEWKMMQSHVDRSLEILRSNRDIPRGALTVAGQHHEKLDGTGYPNGLKGEQINMLARMASICDIFSALTDRRVYKAPIPAEKALSMMQDMGSSIDLYLLRLFRDMMLDHSDQLDI